MTTAIYTLTLLFSLIESHSHCYYDYFYLYYFNILNIILFILITATSLLTILAATVRLATAHLRLLQWMKRELWPHLVVYGRANIVIRINIGISGVGGENCVATARHRVCMCLPVQTSRQRPDYRRHCKEGETNKKRRGKKYPYKTN